MRETLPICNLNSVNENTVDVDIWIWAEPLLKLCSLVYFN